MNGRHDTRPSPLEALGVYLALGASVVMWALIIYSFFAALLEG